MARSLKKTYRLQSEGNQNLKSIYKSDGWLYGWVVTNGGTEARYVKLYDKASEPVLAEDAPVMTIAVPAGTTVVANFDGIPFSKGIAHSIVKKLADTNAEAVAAGELSVTFWYSGS